MSERYLFIGGVANGRRIATDGALCWRISTNYGGSFPSQMGIETYRAERILADQEVFQIYILEGVSIRDAMASLIFNYRPESAGQDGKAAN